MANKMEVKVDMDNMCIDRSTDLGKKFAEFNKFIAESSDPAEREFMTKISAFVEAGIIVDSTLPEADAKAAVEKLRKQMLDEAQS